MFFKSFVKDVSSGFFSGDIGLEWKKWDAYDGVNPDIEHFFSIFFKVFLNSQNLKCGSELACIVCDCPSVFMISKWHVIAHWTCPSKGFLLSLRWNLSTLAYTQDPPHSAPVHLSSFISCCPQLCPSQIIFSFPHTSPKFLQFSSCYLLF